jgi:hypothetical protein
VFCRISKTLFVEHLLLYWAASDIKARSFIGSRFPSFVGVAGKTLKKRGAERQMTLRLNGQPMPGWACGFRGLMYVKSLSSYRQGSGKREQHFPRKQQNPSSFSAEPAPSPFLG